MSLAGQKRVELSAHKCAAASIWLSNYSPPPPTLLGNPASVQAAIKMAEALSMRFAKCGQRKARHNAARTLPRELVTWFGRLLDECVVRAHLAGRPLPPQSVMEAMLACREATSRKPGHPRFERSEAELAVLHFAADNGHYHRQRKRRAIYNQLWKDWTAGLAARGETFITSSEPQPQI